jgi:YD repeat-containing protein
VTQLDQGSAREVRTFNSFGELATQVGTYAGSARLSITYHTTSKPRDALGRVTEKVETLAGTTNTWRYTYDALGRLTDTNLNASAAEHFDYDSNGNRTGYWSPATGNVAATYDEQDRLSSYGDWTYAYGASGELQSKTNELNGDVTSYEYDALGNLLGVWLPDGTAVEYLVDGIGRRVGKKVNGALIQQWLYRDRLKPVAELDGTGTLVSEFVYGSNPNVPEFVMRGSTAYRIISDQLTCLRDAVVRLGDVRHSSTAGRVAVT